jgi:hypothetical protein
MKCPACAAAAPDGAAECPSCGVIFAKLEERKRREREDAKAALAQLDAPPAADVNPYLGRTIAGALLVLWGLVFGYVVLKQLNRPRERSGSFPAAASAPAAPLAPFVPSSAARGADWEPPSGAHSSAVPAPASGPSDSGGQAVLPSGQVVTIHKAGH